MSDQNLLFSEKQRFRQVWLWVMVLGVASLFWAGFVYQLAQVYTQGGHAVEVAGALVLVLLLGLGLPLFFYRMSLTTIVEPGVLKVRFWPFHLKPVVIYLHLVRDYDQVTYNPILEYGGWGIRWTPHGKAYNMSGKRGVKLFFYHQKPIMIGSQHPQQLFNAIAQAKAMRHQDTE